MEPNIKMHIHMILSGFGEFPNPITPQELSQLNMSTVHGRVDMKLLTDFAENNFVFNFEKNQFVLRWENIQQYLERSIKKDILLPPKLNLQMPSFQTVAEEEWKNYFLNYSDIIIDHSEIKELAVSLGTFLQFYFDQNGFYKRVINKELPISI